ncbi:NAD(P)H-dependent oxidoreductase [Agrococcus sp. KRD186]|uniref:NAD(P)H-dependent oxidoreductase n=1 Tax=Agrococcus sp. KRD186 TaxID=2729730 RepID=UPI0019D25582|nr:NAD(P)H-dependent oxidoreductase [Agrococcus sp. KRD186]
MTALVIDAHPNPDSLTAALARSYAEGFGDARVLALRELDFDVHMRFGYTQRMPTEPDLAEARAALHDAAHIAIVTPVWWRSTPALLKGFLDRALLPQQEYRYRSNGVPEGLLAGRSGRVVASADTPALLAPVLPGTRLAALRGGTLGLCGIKPLRMRYLGPVRSSSEETRRGWLELVAHDGQRDAQRAPADPARREAPVTAV